MAPPLLYIICAVGAAALYAVIRSSRRPVAGAAALLGLAAVAWLFVAAADLAVDDAHRPGAFYFIFSLIAVASAVRMITHRRPVYSALYFVLVVVSSAGLFLLLQAEFMAFALIIVYAGAILITYLFVIMLAQQTGLEDDPRGLPEYDTVPREPAAAATVGFVMIALLASMVFRPGQLPEAPPELAATRARWAELERMPVQFRQAVLELEPGFNWPPTPSDGHLIQVEAGGSAYVLGTVGDSADVTRVNLPDDRMPENVQRVGLALVADFPVSLELAGVILLLAMFGAVVLARRQIELGEDEVREAAGMRRFAFHDEHHPDADEGGAP